MRSALATNAFHVLGLPPDAPRAVIEREGQRLIATIELGLAGAREYPSPLGPQPRDADLVRAALAELRDPDRRLLHELWAVPPGDAEPAPDPAADDGPWHEALAIFGWRP